MVFLLHFRQSTTPTSTKLADYILGNVIVEPKGLPPDDFDTMEDFTEVISFGREVMEGKFRDIEDESKSK